MLKNNFGIDVFRGWFQFDLPLHFRFFFPNTSPASYIFKYQKWNEITLVYHFKGREDQRSILRVLRKILTRRKVRLKTLMRTKERRKPIVQFDLLMYYTYVYTVKVLMLSICIYFYATSYYLKVIVSFTHLLGYFKFFFFFF